MNHAIKIEDLELSESQANEYIEVMREFLDALNFSSDRIEAFECRRRDGFIPHWYNKGGLEGICYRDQYSACENTGFENTDKVLERGYKYDLESFLEDRKLTERETLQTLLDTYTQGSFDGMQDLYVYDKAKPEREFSVKYAFLNNEFSEVEREKIKSMLRLKYDVFDDQSSQRVFNRWYDQVVWTKLCELGEY